MNPDAQSIRTAADVGAGSVAFLTFLDYAPEVAACFTILWYLYRFYEKFIKKEKNI